MARRRKNKHEEHVNHEAWAIPYGDLITLLLAFFVVMYATSSLNEGKYRVLSYSIAAAFKHTPSSLNPVQLGDPTIGGPVPPDAVLPLPMDTVQARMQQSGLMPIASMPASEMDLRKQKMTDELHERLGYLVERGDVRIRESEEGMEISIGSDLLFASGEAVLSPDASAVLESLAAVLVEQPNNIVVEGHTDNVPIRNAQFPSNWELSAGRAGRVLRLFSESGMPGARMSMRAYGEQRPEVANDTPENRARNRRVVIIVRQMDRI